jgi:hypothetical protein
MKTTFSGDALSAGATVAIDYRAHRGIDRGLLTNLVKGDWIDANDILIEFNRVFASLTTDDILARHETSYPSRTL